MPDQLQTILDGGDSPAGPGEAAAFDASAAPAVEPVDYGEFTVSDGAAPATAEDGAPHDRAGLSQLDQDFVSDRAATVEHFRSDQAAHEAAGDYAAARDDATQASYALQDIADKGVDVRAELDQTGKDQANLGWADYHQKMADEDVQLAEWHVSGPEVTQSDLDHADTAMAAAAGHAETAAAYGAQADAGGVYADHALTVDVAPAPDPVVEHPAPDPAVDHAYDPPPVD